MALEPDTEAPDEEAIEAFLPGFWQDTRAGRIFVVERRYELDHQHGSYALGRALSIPPQILARVARSERIARIDHRELLFLDTETTGPAGGKGTLAFLVGIGHFLDGGFRLRQYFLDSLDREAALLAALSDYLDPFAGVVTYNGKVFDVPLLETRFILGQLQRDIRALPHLDLLFAARRIYRDRLGSCRLGEIERQVLGLTRTEDVPGFEVPGLYFRYQRYRRFRALMPVFQHNATDVLSLVTLMAHLGELHSPGYPRGPEDELALARCCERDGLRHEAIEHYRAALQRELAPVARDQAERRLSLLYKRTGAWEDAAAIWTETTQRPQNRSVFPLLELASYCERQRRDPAAALRHAGNALELLRRHHIRLGARGALQLEIRLERRISRLGSRIARQSRDTIDERAAAVQEGRT